LESEYVHAEPLKPTPPVPVRVSRPSQLRAALLQHERPIVIEDQDLAQPFVRLLRARDMKLRPLGALVVEMMSYTIRRCYGSDIDHDWYIGGYVLPGNVQKVILKSKAFLPCALLDTRPSAPTIATSRCLAR
jgi:hypothetical protein